eukprot:4869393-Amphidinium_carterae.1
MDNITVDSDGFVDEGSSDVKWDTRKRLRRKHKAAFWLQMSLYPPTTDPVLLQIYRKDALTQVQEAQTINETVEKMEEEHRAFRDAIDKGIKRSIEAKAKAEPEP